MTFDEWYDANTKYMHPADLKAWMSEAWDAATKAEREACAKVCLETDVHPDHGDVAADFLGGHIWGCEDCAAAIRARSNNGND